MYTEEQLLQISPQSHVHYLSESEIIGLFHNCKAIWFHDGRPASPHAELTTGLCSNVYFDCSKVAEYPRIWEILAIQLYKKILHHTYLMQNPHIDWVAGSAYSAITFSYELAKLFSAKHGFLKKDPSDPKRKKIIWEGSRIRPAERVLRIEELITTLETTLEVHRVMKKANPDPDIDFLSVVGCIVHRPPKLPVAYHDIEVVSLIEREVWAVNTKECPLCKKGSKRLRPRENWEELTTSGK